MAKKAFRSVASYEGLIEPEPDRGVLVARLWHLGYRKRLQDHVVLDGEVPEDNVVQRPRLDEPNNDQVVIGLNGTAVPRSLIDSLRLDDSSAVIRSLLRAKFSRKELATHTLSGRPSPAFLRRGEPGKPILDTAIVNDIVRYVIRVCKVSVKDARKAVTSHCADEAKMARQRSTKTFRLALQRSNNTK